MYSYVLCIFFTRTRHPHQIFYVFLCINSYVFLHILLYSYVVCILLPGRAIRTSIFMYAYVFILMHSNVFLCILMKEQRYCDTAAYERTNRL